MVKDIHTFDRIRVKTNAPYFAGQIGVVAYVGTTGVSVQIGDLDDYVPLDWDEIELAQEHRHVPEEAGGAAGQPHAYCRDCGQELGPVE